MVNLERNKALDESWEHDCTYFSLVTDAPVWDNNLSKAKQGMEWVIEEWLSLLLSDERWSKWVNNQSREKKGLNEKSRSDWTYFWICHRCFNWDKRSIQWQRRDWMKNRRDRTYFSLVIDVSMKTSIYPLSETMKGDRAYLSAMTDESNSMEITINLEWETRTWMKFC